MVMWGGGPPDSSLLRLGGTQILPAKIEKPLLWKLFLNHILVKFVCFCINKLIGTFVQNHSIVK